jgi:hypothetical protein
MLPSAIRHPPSAIRHLPMSTRTLRDGLIVGLIAYAAVALFYGVFDLLAGRGLFETVDLLGRAVFRGVRGRELLVHSPAVDFTAVFWYNGLHLAISLAMGLVVVRLVDHAARNPGRSHLMLFAAVFALALTTIAVGIFTRGLRPVVPWWSIVIANWLAMLAAGSYLLSRRRTLWQPFVPRSG